MFNVLKKKIYLLSLRLEIKRENGVDRHILSSCKYKLKL